MTPRKLLGLIFSLVIVFSFLAFMQIDKNNSLSFSATSTLDGKMPLTKQFSLLTFPTFQSQQSLALIKEPSSLTTNSTRTAVYNYVVANPGIQFRGICSGLGIAIGTAEFHLGVLKKAGLISFVRDGKYKRFFASKRFSAKEKTLISLLRHETIRDIFKIIANEKSISHSKLASELSISSQALTWQMNRLREEGIVRETTSGLKVTYSLNDAEVHALPIFLCMTE